MMQVAESVTCIIPARHYFKNIHGDVIFAFTSGKCRSSEYSYGAYGNEGVSYDAFSDPNPIRYSGEYYDYESGMTYLRARYYDPDLRRFISEDPYWDIHNMIYEDNENKVPSLEAILQSSNLYAYCMNNPVMYVDPQGESATLAAIGMAITACIADGVVTAGVYAWNGEDFRAGFVNGFVSCLGTEVGAAIGVATGNPAGVVAGAIIGSSIGSAAGSLAEDLLFNSDKSIEEIAKSAAQSAAWGIISGVGSEYFKYAIDLANEAGSAAQTLMQYDEKFGMALKIFFNEMETILTSQ